MPLSYHASVSRLCHGWYCKNTQKCNIFLLSPRYLSPNSHIERITADVIYDKTHTSVCRIVTKRFVRCADRDTIIGEFLFGLNRRWMSVAGLEYCTVMWFGVPHVGVPLSGRLWKTVLLAAAAWPAVWCLRRLGSSWRRSLHAFSRAVERLPSCTAAFEGRGCTRLWRWRSPAGKCQPSQNTVSEGTDHALCTATVSVSQAERAGKMASEDN